jgi:hypothetical protein
VVYIKNRNSKSNHPTWVLLLLHNYKIGIFQAGKNMRNHELILNHDKISIQFPHFMQL